MPKQKTHKGMQKRFKVTASGKAKHRNANRGHLLSHKGAKRRRRLRHDSVITGANAATVRKALHPAG